MMESKSCCILFFWGSNISTHQKKQCQVLILSSALQGQARSVPSLFAVNCYSYSMVIFPLAFLQLFSLTRYKGAWTCVRKNGTELSTNRDQECEKLWKSALLVGIELVFMIKRAVNMQPMIVLVSFILFSKVKKKNMNSFHWSLIYSFVFTESASSLKLELKTVWMDKFIVKVISQG